MRLYLVQHGKAVDKQANSERPLSEDGIREAKAVAAWLSGKGLAIPEVWHSGKTRAQETAELLAGRLAPDAKLHAQEGLDPNDDVEDLAQELEERENDLMIAGHLPFLAKLASRLLTGDEDAESVTFTYAGVLCLERDSDDLWHVVWLVIPSLCTR